MKYNEQLFEMSKMAKYASGKPQDKKEISAMQRRLLKFMIEALKAKMTDPEVIRNGSATIMFAERFYSKSDPGFEEIKKLIESNNFYSFASEYNIYLTDIECRCYDFSYYELTWDFKSYFNSMKKEGIQRTLKQRNSKGEK